MALGYIYYWKAANARGTDYDCISFQQLTYIQALFILLFKSTNSQGAHSYGWVNTGWIHPNEGLSTNKYGMFGKSASYEVSRMAFFWIHDLWGNLYNFIGGAWNRAGSSSKLYYYWLPRQANSRAWDNNSWDDPYFYMAKQNNLGSTALGTYVSNATGDYTTAVSGTNKGGFVPMNTSNGSDTTYWCDYGYMGASSSNATFPYFGGFYSDQTYAGLFYFCCDIDSNFYAMYFGSRLSYRGGH